MHRRRRFSCLALVFAIVALVPAARADTLPKAESDLLAKLQTTVTNLGYTTTWSSDKQHFYIDWQSHSYTYRIDVAASPDASLVYLYNYIDTFSAAQLAKVPYVKMMEFQNSGNVFFSMDNTSQGEDLYANKVFGGAAITPVYMRQELQGLSDSLDSTDTLWNSKLWK